MATLASIQKLLTREDCEKILQRSVDRPFQLVSFQIAKFHDGVAGFLADHLCLTIKFKTGDVLHKVTYFMKTLPQFNTNQLDYVIGSGVFNKELVVYNNLLTDLLEISHFGPRCYFSKDNLMVLEDLTSQGFKMLPKYDYLSEGNCLAMLRNLAQFHASTIVYERKRGVKLGEKFQEEVKEACYSFVEGEPRQKWLVSCVNCVNDLRKLLPGSNEELLTKFRKFVYEEMPINISASRRFRNVLTHDDLWCNNLLFNDNQQCLFVDFQLVRYTPPALDFLTALYLNLESRYVEKHLRQFMEIYYKFLVEALEGNGLDDSELPRNEFQKSVEYYKLTALTETAMYGTHTFISEELSDEIVDDVKKYDEFSFINRSKYAVKEFQRNAQYRERLTGPLMLLFKALEGRSSEFPQKSRSLIMEANNSIIN